MELLLIEDVACQSASRRGRLTLSLWVEGFLQLSVGSGQ